MKAGGGHKMTMGEVLRQWMVKLEWYSTLFPRIPVPIQKDLMQKLKEHPPQAPGFGGEEEEEQEEEQYQPEEREEPWRARHIPDEEVSFGEAERNLHQRRYSKSLPTQSVLSVFPHFLCDLIYLQCNIIGLKGKKYSYNGLDNFMLEMNSVMPNQFDCFVCLANEIFLS